MRSKRTRRLRRPTRVISAVDVFQYTAATSSTKLSPTVTDNPSCICDETASSTPVCCISLSKASHRNQLPFTIITIIIIESLPFIALLKFHYGYRLVFVSCKQSDKCVQPLYRRCRSYISVCNSVFRPIVHCNHFRSE